MCVLSFQNKVLGPSGIQSNMDPDALGRARSNSPFFSPKPPTSISPCVGRVRRKRQSEHWAATVDMTWLTLFTESTSHKLPRDLLALDRKQCMLVTGLLTGHCMPRQRQYIMGFSGNATCRKCGQEEKSFYHILCQYPVSAKHRLQIFGSALFEPVNTMRASVRMVLTTTLQSGLFKGP